MALRSTFAITSGLQYRLRAAGALLGVTDNTLRTYSDNAGIEVKRASDFSPGAPPVRVFLPETLFQLAQWRRAQGYIKIPQFARSPIVVAIYVIKGGTGKTTTAVELAVHLQMMGLRVALIDIDIQGNATQSMGYEPDLTMDEATAYEVNAEAIVQDTFASIMLPFLDRSRGSLALRAEVGESVIKKPFGEHGPHLIPADTFIGDLEQGLALAKGQRELYIRQMIEASKDGSVPGFNASNYDVILFDCPPNVSFTSTAAMAAADIVVSPIRLDAFSVKGLTKVMNEITAMDEAYKLRPQLVILPTHYSPHLARIGRMQSQLNKYRDMLAPNVISTSEEFPKSLENYLPLSLQKPTSTPASEYRMFAEFMFKKIVELGSKGGGK